MIRVTAKEASTIEGGIYENRLVIHEHKDGQRAAVHNGVLTIYNVVGTTPEFANAIAGYESSGWISWEKA